MSIELRQLSPSDGMDIYDMLQQIPKDENGFVNGGNGLSFDEFKAWLARSEQIAQGIGLLDWQVPQTTHWLIADGVPVGVGKLRHRLTDRLRAEGGHSGYAVAPAHRGRGYGKALLRLLIGEAGKLGIGEVLVTIRNDNLASIGVAMANGGAIEKVDAERHFIWIPCPAGQPGK